MSDSKIGDLINRFHRDWTDEIRGTRYVLADTRVAAVSLYDHLRLTAGVAVALVDELLSRGLTSKEICESEIDNAELKALASLCGWMHDIGKIKEGYRGHVERSVKITREWLLRCNVKDVNSIIINAVERHHLDRNPKTILEKSICLADSYASAGDRPELSRASTEQEFSRIIESTKKMEQELFGSKAPLSLILGDADSIKSYVYETNVLPEIRGASQILQNTENEIRKIFKEELSEECLIYCGGGGFLGLSSAAKAEKIADKIQKIYLENTKILTTTVVYSDPLGYPEFSRGIYPYDDESVNSLNGSGVAGDLLFSHFEAHRIPRTKRKNFGELVSKLSSRLQQTKRLKDRYPFEERMPIQLPCESCGKRPASNYDSVRTEWICNVCSSKRSEGVGKKLSFVEDFADWVKEKKGVDVVRIPAKDLDQLGDKIALIYADGNNIGDLLQLAPSPATYAHISAALSEAVKESLFEAICESYGVNNLDSQPFLPFEIIVVGGDDLVIITEASKGWLLTLKILEEFENNELIKNLSKEIASRLGKDIRITMSAGIAVADVKYPINFLFTLCSDLLRLAKRVAREAFESAVCHLWLRSPVVSESASTIIKDLYDISTYRQSFSLTQRPYRLEQAKKLSEEARKLAKLTRSQRRLIAQSLHKGKKFSINYVMYQLERLGDKQLTGEIEKSLLALGKLAGNSGVNSDMFWSVSDGVWKTPLLDALELLEMNAVSR